MGAGQENPCEVRCGSCDPEAALGLSSFFFVLSCILLPKKLLCSFIYYLTYFTLLCIFLIYHLLSIDFFFVYEIQKIAKEEGSLQVRFVVLFRTFGTNKLIFLDVLDIHVLTLIV